MTSTAHKKFDLMLFTIGHSNHSLENFLELLNMYGINCLIDVRSIPYSSYHKDFSRENLQKQLQQRQVEYRWMGDSLGGKKEEHISAAGMRIDDLYHSDPTYRAGIVDLMRTSLKKRTVIMCSEEDPRTCHRHKIITKTLLRRMIPECHKLNEISVFHIRSDGQIENASNIVVAIQKALPF